MRPIECVPVACRGELKLEFISSAVLTVGAWPVSPSYLLMSRLRFSGISHPTCPVAILSQDIQRPDAVFGLRQTSNIENLLNDIRKRELGVMKPGETQQLHEFLYFPSSKTRESTRGQDIVSILVVGIQIELPEPPSLERLRTVKDRRTGH